MLAFKLIHISKMSPCRHSGETVLVPYRYGNDPQRLSCIEAIRKIMITGYGKFILHIPGAPFTNMV